MNDDLRKKMVSMAAAALGVVLVGGGVGCGGASEEVVEAETVEGGEQHCSGGSGAEHHCAANMGGEHSCSSEGEPPHEHDEHPEE